MNSPGENVDRDMQRAREFQHLEEAKQAEEEMPINTNVVKKNHKVGGKQENMVISQRREQ